MSISEGGNSAEMFCLLSKQGLLLISLETDSYLLEYPTFLKGLCVQESKQKIKKFVLPIKMRKKIIFQEYLFLLKGGNYVILMFKN